MSLHDVTATLDLDGVARLLCTRLPNDREMLTQWLHDEGLVVADGRGFYVTNLGVIAAARKLGDFGTLKRKAVRVVRYRARTRSRPNTSSRVNEATRSASKDSSDM